MSTADARPLHLVEPLHRNRMQYAWLLKLKYQAHRAYDAVAHAPRAAASWAARAVAMIKNPRIVLSALRAVISRARTSAGWQGLAAAALAATSSKTVRRLGRRATTCMMNALRSTGHAALTLITRSLNLFGDPGVRLTVGLERKLAAAGFYVKITSSLIRDWTRNFFVRYETAMRAGGQLLRLVVLQRLIPGGRMRPAHAGLALTSLSGGLLRNGAHKVWRLLTTAFRPQPFPTPPAAPRTYPASWAAHEAGLADDVAANGDLDPADEEKDLPDAAAAWPGNRAERRAQARAGNRKRNQNKRHAS